MLAAEDGIEVVLELVEGLTPQPGQLSGTSADGGFIINVPGGPLFYDAGSEQHLFLFGSNDGGTCLYKGALVADTQVAASPVDRTRRAE